VTTAIEPGKLKVVSTALASLLPVVVR